MSKQFRLFLGVLLTFLALAASAQEHSQRYRIYSQQNGAVNQNIPQGGMMMPPPREGQGSGQARPPGSLRSQ